MGFIERTYKTEFQGDRELMVVDKELDHIVNRLNSVLEAAGLNPDGTFSSITTNNITVNNQITGITPGVNSSLLIIASRTLNDAQIKAIGSYELKLGDGSSSAPGYGFVCTLVKMAWSLDTTGGAYTGMSGMELRIRSGNIVQANTSPVDAFFGSAGTFYGPQEPLVTGVPGPGADASLANNQPLYLDLLNPSALTGGGSANTLTVYAYYVITPLDGTGAVSQLNWTSTGQLVWPPAADGVSVTPDGTAMVDSVWVEVVASASVDSLLTGVMVRPGVGGILFFIEVGIGAASSEVTIAEIFGVCHATGFVANGYEMWSLPIRSIPAGSRVAIRMRKTGTSTAAWLYALTYLPQALTGNVDSTDNIPTVLQDWPVTTQAPPSSFVGSSSWLVRGTASTPLFVCGFMCNTTQSLVDYEIDLATGAPGSERLLTTLRGTFDCPGGNATQGGHIYVPVRPMVGGINTGDILSSRIRSSGGGTWELYLLVCDATDAPYSLLSQDVAQGFPAGQTGINTVTGGSAWSSGSWTEFSASIPADIAIMSASFFMDTAGSFEFDIGVGAAGSEVVKYTFRMQAQSGNSGDNHHFTFPIALELSGRQRVAVRGRGTTASANNQFSFNVVPAPSFPQRTSVTTGAFPAAATNALVAGNVSAWANSAWVQLASSVGAADVYLYNVPYDPPAISVEFEIDIGIGAAASETVLTTLRSWHQSAQGMSNLPLPVPTKVAAGTRLSVRIRKQGTDTQNWGFAVNYYGDLFA